MGRLTNPLPTFPERRNVRYYTEHGFLASEHGFGFDTAEPNLKRSERLASLFGGSSVQQIDRRPVLAEREIYAVYGNLRRLP